MVYIPVSHTRVEQVPMNPNCEVSVKIDSSTWQCLTREQYQVYQAQYEAQQQIEWNAYHNSIWSILGIIGVVILVVGGFLKGLMEDYIGGFGAGLVLALIGGMFGVIWLMITWMIVNGFS